MDRKQRGTPSKGAIGGLVAGFLLASVLGGVATGAFARSEPRAAVRHTGSRVADAKAAPRRAQSGERQSDADFDAAVRAWHDCMRERVDGFPLAPDQPGAAESFNSFLASRNDTDGNLSIGEYADVDAAHEECRHYLPNDGRP